MKLISRWIALLLTAAIMLSLLCMPAAADKAVDFKALAEKGSETPGAGVIITAEPKFYVSALGSFLDKYTVYYNQNTGHYGVADCFGNVYWEADSSVNYLELVTPEIVSAIGWQPYTISGKLLCPENLSCQEPFGIRDGATGELKYAVGLYSDSSDPDSTLLGILTDSQGHSIQGEFDPNLIPANGLQLPYNAMIPCRRDGKWGLQRITGEQILPWEYDYLEFISAKELLAANGESWFVIDLTGKTLRQLGSYSQIESLLFPGRDRIIAVKDGMYGVIDSQGNIQVPFQYDDIYLHDSTSPVRHYMAKTAGIWHFVGEAGSGIDLTLGASTDDYIVQVLTEHVFFLKDIRQALGGTVVDGSGKRLLPGSYQNPILSEDGMFFAVYSQDNQGTVYRNDLTALTDFSMTNGGGFTKDGFAAQADGKAVFYDKSGNLLAEVQNVSGMETAQEYVLLFRNGKCALADPRGNLLTEFDYIFGATWTGAQGLAALQKEDGWYLFNSRGEQLTDYVLKDYPNFSITPANTKQFAAFQVGNKVGFMKYRAEGEPLFLDTSAKAWYTKAVTFCTNAGLMNGTGHGSFSPKAQMTRAMLVQVLYNISGEKTAPYGFRDIKSGKWYADAVNWAAANEIVTGKTADTFGPNDPVTREQMVVILYRYAKRFGSMEGSADVLAGYKDAKKISSYAKSAMAWAVEQGILTGKTADTLVPQGVATRGEIATVLMRFVKYMANTVS